MELYVTNKKCGEHPVYVVHDIIVDIFSDVDMATLPHSSNPSYLHIYEVLQ